jgi:hypothetical protein
MARDYKIINKTNTYINHKAATEDLDTPLRGTQRAQRKPEQQKPLTNGAKPEEHRVSLFSVFSVNSVAKELGF